MTLDWLIYISVNMIAPDQLEQEIGVIVATACGRNAALGITGALVATTTHLSQYIEGPGDAVADLLDRIGRDPRHTGLQVIDRGTRTQRLFPDWHMVYAGNSVFVRRRLAELFDASPEGRFTRGERLIDLMREFAKNPD